MVLDVGEKRGRGGVMNVDNNNNKKQALDCQMQKKSK